MILLLTLKINNVLQANVRSPQIQTQPLKPLAADASQKSNMMRVDSLFRMSSPVTQAE